MKKYLAVIVMVIALFSFADTSNAEISVSGDFKYLPRAKKVVAGVGVMVADFRKDVSAEPVSFLSKLGHSTTLGGSVAWALNNQSIEDTKNVLPDYGGVEITVDVMYLLKNLGATQTNPDIGVSFAAGGLIDLTALKGDDPKLRFEPAIGAKLNLQF